MAFNKNHQTHMDMMGAFEGAEKTTPRNTRLGGGNYGMATSTGLPRSAAQMASVKKAAAKSAQARGERAGSLSANPLTRASAAPGTGPRPPNAAKQGEVPGLSTGGVSLAKQRKKGLLSL